MHIERKVDCAVLLYDDFTGKLLSGSQVSVARADGHSAKPIKKGDGYFVFLQEGRPIEALLAQGPLYQPQLIRIPERNTGLRELVHLVRMVPARWYPLPAQTTCVTGTAPPGETVFVTGELPGESLKLMADYNPDGPCELSLFIAPERGLEGCALAISGGKNKKDAREIFTVSRVINEQEGVFGLTAPLSGTYVKQDAKLYRVFRCTADDAGRYYLPIPNVTGAPWKCIVGVSGLEREVTLLAGITNEVILTGGKGVV
jgi:hypothetical protein